MNRNRDTGKGYITLVDSDTAYVGYRFIYKQYPECNKCKYYSVCNKLEEGRIYEVTKVLNSENNIKCLITGEYMKPVEVRLGNIYTTIREGIPFDIDVLIHWHGLHCSYGGCRFRKICFPRGLKEGDKIKIKRVVGKVDCPLNIGLLEIDAEIVK